MPFVCTDYYGETITIGKFKTLEEAKEFIKHPAVLYNADEIENGEEDEVVFPEDMYINESDIPLGPGLECNDDDLPF